MYLWHKDQAKNDGSAHQKPSAEQSGKTINNILQRVRGQNGHSQYDTGHIDGDSYILGVVETFDLDLTDREGKNKCNDLQQHLVAIEDAKKDASSSGFANINKIIDNNIKFLKREWR